MVSFATLFALLFLMAFAALVFNVGQATTRKIEAQNAADAVAYSSSVWVARGMNAITASNHLMGELTALYILHHSLGGKWLDENEWEKKNNHQAIRPANRFLAKGYRSARLIRGSVRTSTAYDKVKINPNASVESTVFDAKQRLKYALGGAYFAKAAGAGMEKSKFPPVVAAGIVLQFLSTATAEWIRLEYIFLDGVEIIAQKLKPLAHLAIGVDNKGNDAFGAVPALSRYQTLMQAGILAQSVQVAGEVADKHHAKGFAVGDISNLAGGFGDLDQLVPGMPIERHEHEGEPRSQFMRATYPWVCHWRRPVRTFLRLAPISQASSYYTHYTHLYSKEAMIWLRKEGAYRGFAARKGQNNGDGFGMGKQCKNLRLYVVIGLNQTASNGKGFQKSMEKWNQPGNSPEVERRFTHLGFARIEPIAIASGAVYRQENPDGFVAFAHSMIYNGNRQSKPRKAGRQPYQTPAGWDTLNWDSDVVEYDEDNKGAGNRGAPKIKLNWQAKLTPSTELKLAGSTAMATLVGKFGDGKMSGPLLRSGIEGLYLNNH